MSGLSHRFSQRTHLHNHDLRVRTDPSMWGGKADTIRHLSLSEGLTHRDTNIAVKVLCAVPPLVLVPQAVTKSRDVCTRDGQRHGEH